MLPLAGICPSCLVLSKSGDGLPWKDMLATPPLPSPPSLNRVVPLVGSLVHPEQAQRADKLLPVQVQQVSDHTPLSSAFFGSSFLGWRLPSEFVGHGWSTSY